VFEVPQAVAAHAPSTRKLRFRAAHLLLRFLRDRRSSHCTPPRGSGSGFSPISKFALTSGTRSRDCRSFILWIKHISLAIDNLFVLCDRHVDAGAALGVAALDGLRQRGPLVPAIPVTAPSPDQANALASGRRLWRSSQSISA